METLKENLAPFVPRLKKAISELTDTKSVEDFAIGFIMDLAGQCLPAHTVEITKIQDPQEESKEEMVHRSYLAQLTQCCKEFHTFVS